MNISKFVNNPGKPFHTSGYAQAANGDSMGASSSQSFNERSRVEKNRQAIRSYRTSMIAQGSVRSNVEPQPLPSPRTNLRVDTREQMNGRQLGGVPPVAPQKPMFQEPPRRSYNPFG